MSLSMGMGPAWRHMRTDRERRCKSADRRRARSAASWPSPARTGGRSPSSSLVTVVDAVLVVVNPLLVQRIVDDGILGGDTELVTVLALAMAAIAAGRRRALGARRLALLPDRRGPDLRPAHPGLRPRPAPVARLLHPHPDRRAGLPAQQRRDRRAAGVHVHPVQHRLQLDLGRRRRHRDARAELAGHAAVPALFPLLLLASRLGSGRLAGADPRADGRQRRHGQR